MGNKVKPIIVDQKYITWSNYLLYPLTSAFQALVPRGSICIPVPERGGPITNHLNAKDENGFMTMIRKVNCSNSDVMAPTETSRANNEYEIKDINKISQSTE
ncbi:unnamed protein product [Schistosoma curassoni]|uniref:DDE-1 domain-containing protein n=1 Tax=Schistosoma curassoni TaxID=6186 RepID=A0A183JVD0_9TREM|nr:unnamed protein product [Schistosoma curassoni]